MFGLFGFIALVGSLACCIGLVIASLALICFKKIPSDSAGIRTGLGGIMVKRDWILRLPIVHHFDLMDMSIQEIKIKLKGVNGVRCKDNIRADIEASFYVRVNHDEESICEVATSIGCEHASDVGTLKGLFEAKFSDSLQAVASQYDNEELCKTREEFRHSIRTYIGSDLNGFLLEDVAIDYLEQTPKEAHDPSDILDAKAIEKIARLTAQSQEAANKTIYEMEVKQHEQAVAAELKRLDLARHKAEALAKMQRELEDALKETFPDKNKIEELRSQIAQLEEQDSSES